MPSKECKCSNAYVATNVVSALARNSVNNEVACLTQRNSNVEHLNLNSNSNIYKSSMLIKNEVNVNMCALDTLTKSIQGRQIENCSEKTEETRTREYRSSEVSSSQESEDETCIHVDETEMAELQRLDLSKNLEYVCTKNASHENSDLTSNCKYKENKNGCQDKYFKIPHMQATPSSTSPPILYGNERQNLQRNAHVKPRREEKDSTHLVTYCSCDNPGNYLGSVILDPTSYRFPKSSSSLYEARIAANGVTLFCNKTETFYDDIYEFVLNARKSEMERVTAQIKQYDYCVENETAVIGSETKRFEAKETYLLEKQSLKDLDYFFAEREDDIFDPYNNGFDADTEEIS